MSHPKELPRWVIIKFDAHFFCFRFEPDMLAFSGCYYGGGEKERKDLGAIRKRWKTLHVRHSIKLAHTCIQDSVNPILDLLQIDLQ